MTWSTRSSDRDRNFIVIRHKLRETDGLISGIKFRGGYGVVDKNSRYYHSLQKLPLLKNQPEYPLTHLSTLSFIPRSSEIKLVYGEEVYRHFLLAVKKEREAQEEIVTKAAEAVKLVNQAERLEKVELVGRCEFIAKSDYQCKNEKHPKSLEGFCKNHILQDKTTAKSVGVKLPGMLTTSQKKELKKKILQRLDSR